MLTDTLIYNAEKSNMLLDQRAELVRLLELLGVAQDWHVVRPLPGDMRDQVLIQNEARQINVEVPLSSENIQDLSDERKIAIIRNAIVKAAEMTPRPPHQNNRPT